MKVIDAFLYFNEKSLLSVRLDYLDSAVDEFWICESTVDFAGKSRKPELETLLKGEGFERFERKVRLVLHSPNLSSLKFQLRKLLGRNLGWLIQNDQRNYFGREILKHSGACNATILFGDLDEIPDKSLIPHLIGHNKPISLQQTLYYGSLLHKTVVDWRGTVCITPDTIRLLGLSKIRGSREQFPFLASAGWHFSYFGGSTLIREKINAISVSENLSVEKWSERAILNIGRGVDPFDRESTIKRLVVPDIPETLLATFDARFSEARGIQPKLHHG